MRLEPKGAPTISEAFFSKHTKFTDAQHVEFSFKEEITLSNFCHLMDAGEKYQFQHKLSTMSLLSQTAINSNEI